MVSFSETSCSLLGRLAVVHNRSDAGGGPARPISHTMADYERQEGRERRGTDFVFLLAPRAMNPVVRGDIVVSDFLNSVGGYRHKARRDRLLDILDVDLDWHMHQISDGERRRVQLCMGLMGDWDVLLLDEVRPAPSPRADRMANNVDIVMLRAFSGHRRLGRARPRRPAYVFEGGFGNPRGDYYVCVSRGASFGITHEPNGTQPQTPHTSSTDWKNGSHT